MTTGARNLPQLRTQIAKEMKREMVLCDHDKFRHYLPSTPPTGHIRSAVNLLVEEGILKRVCHNKLAWAIDFVDSDREDKYFAFLLEVCKVLERTADTVGKKAHFRLVHKPTSAKSSIWGGPHGMDGYFYLQEEEDGEKTVEDIMHHIGVVHEYKKYASDQDVAENRRQILANATFAMNEDPRRMFMFGLTIEGDLASTWYFSRSHSAVSTGFDWRNSPKDLIILLLTFMFATPAQLGFDPTIRRVIPGGNRPQYLVYEVKDTKTGQTRAYQTLRSISAYHSLRITGRSTRVWLVQEVKSMTDVEPVLKGKYSVLKDVWLDKTAKTEREIREEIIRDFRRVANQGLADNLAFKALPADLQSLVESHRNSPEAHFLSIECDAVGEISLEPQAEVSCCPNIFDDPQVALHAPRLRTADPTRSLSSLDSPVLDNIPAPHRDYVQKRQYRVVFEEICTAVHWLESFRDSIKAMQDVVIALAILYIAGWVHRDISGGNLLWYKGKGLQGRGLLGDLEYAKRFSCTNPSADPKTGTPYFMAHEILTQESLYAPTRHDVRLGKRKRLVWSNFFHDLESMLWLYLWIILHRLGHPASKLLAALIFQNSLTPSAKRTSVFTSSGALYAELVGNLHSAVELLADDICDTRDLLFKAYTELDDISDLSRYGPAYGQLYKLCSKTLQRCDDMLAHGISEPKLVTPPCPRNDTARSRKGYVAPASVPATAFPVVFQASPESLEASLIEGLSPAKSTHASEDKTE